MLAIIHTFIREEDALKALTILEQPGLPVSLTQTLELAADFAKASDGTCDAGGPVGSELRITETKGNWRARVARHLGIRAAA